MKHRPGVGMTSQSSRDRLVRRLQEQGIEHPAVLEALAATPRHLFIDEAMSSHAYENTSLPIGLGQTISQPYIVARMSEAMLADNDALDKVLEIGTGSGYQAAVLSLLCRRVFTVERIEPLLRQARRRFHSLGLHNIFTRYADGQQGWLSQAPFAGIMVTAACPQIPDALLQQLAPGARLVAPVNAPARLEQASVQQLLVITRTDDGFAREHLEDVSFVPLLPGLA